MTKDHAKLLRRTTQVRHDLQHLFSHCRSVDGHSPLTIVYTDSHTNMQRPVWVESAFRTDAGGLKTPGAAHTGYRLSQFPARAGGAPHHALKSRQSQYPECLGGYAEFG
jgi:hypothetical protein